MELIKIDRNGSKHYAARVKCDRCNGRGMYYWGAIINGIPQYSGTCFKCGGSGLMDEIIIERTPEYQAKLDAKREARQAEREAKYNAAIAEREAKREAEQAEREREQAEREAERNAIKANSKHICDVGSRVTLTLTLEHSVSYRVQGAYCMETRYIHLMRDDNGNAVVWKTGNGLNVQLDDNFIVAQDGDKVTLKATVKEHGEYNEEKQTILTRCKVLAIEKGENQ